MFTSHAQNFEDVMLWRALGHLDRGFYIDVGAAWPDAGSVTAAFYDRGWSGINIEPVPSLWRLLCKERIRDVNLQLALSDAPGERDIHVVEETGLTTFDGDLATAHAARGMRVRQERTQVATLSDVWRSWVGGRDVHFLKIDVEGAEREVLQGNDWRLNRPWILVIEATAPLSTVEVHAAWEPLILDSGYVLAYRDGVNRFYVATEHSELLPALADPPNVFDRFISAGQAAAEREALRAHAEVRALTAQLRKAADRIGRIKAGRTWKIARFLRSLARLRWLRGKWGASSGDRRKSTPVDAKAAHGAPSGPLETRILNSLVYLRRVKSR